MKKTAIVVLLFSVGVSQQHHKVIETYDNGNIKSITYHEETRTKLEKVKYVKNCLCTEEDWECDEGFIRHGDGAC